MIGVLRAMWGGLVNVLTWVKAIGSWLLSFKMAFAAAVVGGVWWAIDHIQDYVMGILVGAPGLGDAHASWGAAIGAWGSEFWPFDWWNFLESVHFFVGLDTVVDCGAVFLAVGVGLVVYKLVWRAIPTVG